MLLIRGAMLPDFETGTTTQADVLIRDGRFAAIAPHLEADCPIVEASGLLLLPGMADLHTHMVQSLTQGPLDDLNIGESTYLQIIGNAKDYVYITTPYLIITD